MSWKNLEDYALNFSVQPAKALKLSLEYHWFRLAQAQDAWYWVNRRPERRDPTGEAGRDLGNELDAIEVMTGDLAPPGCDVVVPVEWCQRIEDRVSIQVPGDDTAGFVEVAPDPQALEPGTPLPSFPGKAEFHTAIIAGTQAVKRTSDLIPFCHPLPIEGCAIEARDLPDGLLLSCEVRTTHKTGVEMEALTGAAIAALSVIDMCKALTPEISIASIELVKKSGGKRDYQRS